VGDTGSTAPTRFHFSTAALPGGDRLAIWREVFGRKLARLDISPVAMERGYEAEVTALALPGLSISHGSNRGVRSARTRELIGDGNDDLLFGIVTSGSVSVTQCGRDTTVGAGEATMLSSAIPNTAEAPGHLTLFNVALPYRALSSRVKNLEDRCARRISQDVVVRRLLGFYVKTVFEQPVERFTEEFRLTAATHIQDLVSLALGAAPDVAEVARERGMRAARLEAVKTEMARHLADPTLSADRIATRLGLSTRYIRRLLAGEGASFSERMLELRLQRAYGLLSDPARQWHTISSIAFELGFGDLSYFNRTFRRRFGGTPSDVRQSRAVSKPA
jgi:AraC-like DNA-binding protein